MPTRFRGCCPTRCAKGLKQTITVEAKPGAGGNLASAEVAKAAPDGYTLMLFTTGARDLGGDVQVAAIRSRSTTSPFITTVSELPFFIVVNPAKSPHKTIRGLVAAAKAKPGGITVGTAGVGTGQHLATELLNSMIGAKMVHVPYRGDSGAVTGLLSGDIDFIVAPLPAIRATCRPARSVRWRHAAKPWPACRRSADRVRRSRIRRGDGLDRCRDDQGHAEAGRRQAQQRVAPRHRLAAGREEAARLRRRAGLVDAGADHRQGEDPRSRAGTR